MFLILVRNILCPQQMFPSLRNMRYIMSNNVSATMCPRLPVPLLLLFFIYHNRRAVGKIVGNKTCDVTVGELKKCGKFDTVLVSTSQ